MFRRLYFDTNTLYGSWPRISGATEELFRQCKALGVAIVLPLPVESELERQYFEQAEQLHQSATAKEDALCTHLERVSDQVRFAPSNLPHPDLFFDAYEKTVQALKAEWNIVSAPFTTEPVETLFDMAINGSSPFKRAKDDQVFGFQDAVILFSVFYDIERNGGAPAAFVSNDRGFHELGLLKQCADAYPQLSFFKNISSVSASMSDRFREFLPPEMSHNEKSVLNTLWDHRGVLNSWLEKMISLEDVRSWLGDEVCALRAITFNKAIAAQIDATAKTPACTVRFLLDVSIRYEIPKPRPAPDVIHTRFDRAPEKTASVQVILTSEAILHEHEIQNLNLKSAKLSGFAEFLGLGPPSLGS